VTGSKTSTTYVSNCGGVEMLGGFNLFGKAAKITKPFTLPIHNSILIKF
jgi:hypothetical protein